MHHARQIFFATLIGYPPLLILVSFFWPTALWSVLIVGPLLLVGIYDIFQGKRAILRNFPVIGHLRYLIEDIRPEIQQYVIEQNLEGRPLNREERSVVYQRAKRVLSTSPFGTQADVYAEGYEWMNHSLRPAKKPKHGDYPRITIGGKHCTQPYNAAVFNISAMSYGSLSANAVRALNEGARRGRFFHNTGEGGISSHHLEPGGDICWQIGTGYFGCRQKDGSFDPGLFGEKAKHPHVKLIELKLSQGAKPGKGGILPAAKITDEIAAIRHVSKGQDVISPASHSSFSTPTELLEFIQKLRELSGGKPTGFKLCIGKRREFIAICKAMLETGITPDFITVDGGEGGTGAAPLEFSNSVGTPLVEGLVFAHNALVGFDLRKDIKVIASGRTTTAFGIAKRLAIGADAVNAARAFMLALGCIQALKCNSNTCPTGVATQDPKLVQGLVVPDKATRVYQYHDETLYTLVGLLAASGLTHTSQLRPWHIHRRVTQFEVHHYAEMFEYLKPGDLLEEPLPRSFARAWRAASAKTFDHAAPDPVPFQASEAEKSESEATPEPAPAK